VVAYLQLAHNERHLQTGNSVAEVSHNFGWADQVDRAVWRCANRHTQSKVNRPQLQAVVDDLVPGLAAGYSVGPVTATRALRRAGHRVGTRLRRPACRLGRSMAAGTGQS
jgi:hypothetical protein